MSYDTLVGRLFTKNGAKYMIVKHENATVVAACREAARVRRVIVPLAEALALLDVDEIELTEVAPEATDEAAAPRRARDANAAV